MQNFNIFGGREGFNFEFASLSWIGNLKKNIFPGQAHQSVAQGVLTTRASHRARAAHHWPSHRMVTTFTVESVLVPVTAGRR
jgi:hypothetical protein